MANTGLMFSEHGFKHTVPPGHPECPERLAAIREGIESANLNLPKIEPRPATWKELGWIHTASHIGEIEKTCAESLPYPDADTYMMPASWDAALMGAGGAIEACGKVLHGEFDNAFCVMRPPGHHAEADHAMGFCLFNNVAIAAKWLQEEGGLNRVAILDWDVHHGNGTQHSFYDDPTVYYASLHQWPHYPGTGLAEERGAENTNLNFPMAAYTPAEVWLDTIKEKVIPELEKFNPDFLLISCGFDAHELDPLSSQHLETDHYGEITRMVKHLANGKIVSCLEGGYSLEALKEAPVAHLQGLIE
jgi:acetoin utilization deacetylase AcuC-like enzyme